MVVEVAIFLLGSRYLYAINPPIAARDTCCRWNWRTAWRQGRQGWCLPEPRGGALSPFSAVTRLIDFAVAFATISDAAPRLSDTCLVVPDVVCYEGAE